MTDEAYDKLSDRLTRMKPDCEGIDLFTADNITPADAYVLALVCADCPLRLPCRQYADLAKPTAGYWAGHYRRTYKPRRKGHDDAA